jgi:hypothetical protein
MSATCQTCTWWTGHFCRNEQSSHYHLLTGAGWTCPEFQARSSSVGFAEFLGQLCPVKGRGRGRRHELAAALSVTDVCVYHWIKGHAVPARALVPQIAAYLDRPVDEIERMVLADVRQRAEKTWRNEQGREDSC